MCWPTVSKFFCGHLGIHSKTVNECESKHLGKACTPEEKVPSYRSIYRACPDCTPPPTPANTPIEAPLASTSIGREFPFPSFDSSSYSLKHVTIVGHFFVSNNGTDGLDLIHDDSSRTTMTIADIKDGEAGAGIKDGKKARGNRRARRLPYGWTA